MAIAERYYFVNIIAEDEKRVQDDDHVNMVIHVHSDGASVAMFPELDPSTMGTFTKLVDALNYFGSHSWNVVSYDKETKYKRLLYKIIIRKTLPSPGEEKKNIKIPITFDSSASIDLGNLIPINSRIIAVHVAVDTVFDGTTPTLTIGTAASPAQLMLSTENNLTSGGIYTVNPGINYASETQLTATYVAGGSTAGSADVIIEYV